MHTPKDVAEWMVKRLDRYGILNQQKAAHAIEKRFGLDFVYLLGGALSIDRRVLYQYRKLTGDDVVWVTQHGGGFCEEAHWRRRDSGDTPGRTQYLEG